jgi:hypothetical protein
VCSSVLALMEVFGIAPGFTHFARVALAAVPFYLAMLWAALWAVNNVNYSCRSC